ncbi:RluA family pseudouridine synthase [Alicyclobacillus sp.]|uniref:RluA family pseudouridine synthase n=1 Tax=Alicyclobacillus sp. TaxID=61169 RepID=UPI0025BA929F|nr:RluA family pseudouridine synthase [Alicyclobacillus sp.]MCL6515673.1 RluA family pseudouridine synthase [Alicyclobacillus sp.]
MDVGIHKDALVAVVPAGMAGQPCRHLLRALSLPDALVERLFRQGAVRLGQSPVHPDQPLVTGARVHLLGGVEEPEPLLEEGVPDAGWPAVDVLYEDDHQLVVNKPSGILVHPGGPADTDTMAHRVAWHLWCEGLARRARHVHRLDKDTTGALLYAKHSWAARALDRQLAEGLISRVYWAIVVGRLTPDDGVIDEPIGRDRHVAGRFRVSATGKPARTRYTTLDAARQAGGWVSLVECRLDTGRTHQIRVHLSHRGCPVVGDTLYGGGRGAGSLPWNEGHALHARTISFRHLYSGDPLQVEAPLPPAFRAALDAWGLTV